MTWHIVCEIYQIQRILKYSSVRFEWMESHVSSKDECIYFSKRIKATYNVSLLYSLFNAEDQIILIFFCKYALNVYDTNTLKQIIINAL